MKHGDENFITTITGRKFWPLDPRPEDICIEDIAHALAHICRFNGHVRRFYSVAQHCVMVSRFVRPPASLRAHGEALDRLERIYALEGLVHDTPEAYLGDMTGPVKHAAEMRLYRSADDTLLRVIRESFGLTGAQPPEVKQIDHLILQDEARELTPNLARPSALRGPGLGIQIHPVDPDEAKHMFIQRFYQLHGVKEGAAA